MSRTVADLALGEMGILADFDLPDSLAGRLMEHGFLPGASVRAVRSAPGGDPRVFRVDGGDVALRLETARQLRLEETP
jgi:ferrous iron transport protein A